MIRSVKKTILNGLSPETKDGLRAFVKRMPVARSVLLRHKGKPSPVFLVSFPKTGRTWLTLMVGKAVGLHLRLKSFNPLDLVGQLQKINSNLPNILVIHDDVPHWKRPHELEELKTSYKNTKVIFLVRDPRDVVVSLYFEKKKRLLSYLEGERKVYEGYFNDERIQPYEHDLSSFINEEEGSFATLLTYYNVWAKNRHIPEDFLNIRYEDIHENPNRELRKVLDFLGFERVSDKNINEAVTFASFKNMQKMERENSFDDYRLRPANTEDKESFKTRQGKVGGFTDYLTSDEIGLINKKMNATLSEYFNYSVKD
jgi:hypothetical protein